MQSAQRLGGAIGSAGRTVGSAIGNTLGNTVGRPAGTFLSNQRDRILRRPRPAGDQLA